MAKKKRVGKCYLCGGDLRKPQRYRPDGLNGKSVLVCEDCLEEARFGKFGYENKRYKPGLDVSFFKGKGIRNR